MQANVESIGKNRVSIEIGLDTAEVDKALGEAYQRVVHKVKIPGFRKGKAPRPILEAHYGKEILYEDAVDIMIPEAYHRALDEHKLEPIDRPELSVVEPVEQGKPFVFKATVQVLPEVSLGKYTGVKVKKPTTDVAESDVEKRLQSLREQYAELVLVDHDELTAGDYAVVDFDGYIDGQPFQGGSATGYTLEIGGEGYLSGFSEGMIGLRPGETREIPVRFPAEYRQEDLAGKEALFKVTLREIKQRLLPELDEEFAKSLGHDSTEKLTEEVRSSLRANAERETERIFTDRVVDAVTGEARVDIPEVLVTRQMGHRFESLKNTLRYQGIEIDQYLADLGKTEDEIKDEMRPQAEVEVRRDLVIGAIRKAEGIEPTEEEVEDRVKELSALSRVKDPEKFRRTLERNGRLEGIRDGLAREKTIRFLVEKAVPQLERDRK